MFKRILAVVSFLLAFALSISVLAQIVLNVKATEKEAVITFVEATEVTEPAESNEATRKIVVSETTKLPEPKVKFVVTEDEEKQENEPESVESQDSNFEYVEKFPEVPLYNQLDYGTTRYGDSTVRKSGCGIACYAMVLSYLHDREILPDELADMYHRYKVKGGSSHCLFTNTQEEWGVTVENCYWKEAWLDGKVMEALRNGQPIIANVHKDSAFTDGGHFIVLYGLTEDGKILVRDPNGANYMAKGFLAEGFANGFEPSYFRKISANYFIYQAKDLDAIAARAEAEALNSEEA